MNTYFGLHLYQRYRGIVAIDVLKYQYIYIAASSRSKLPGLVSKYLHFFSDLD